MDAKMVALVFTVGRYLACILGERNITEMILACMDITHRLWSLLNYASFSVNTFWRCLRII